MIWAVVWYWLLGIFTVADIITTKVAISLGAHEVNPVMAGVLDHLVEVKIAYLLLMVGVVYWIERSHAGSGWIAPAGASCVTFAAVVSNLLFFIQ